MGFSFGDNWLIASSNIVFTRVESGDIPIFYATNNPSKQSTIGDKYIFPEGIANSVISVNHLLLGFSTEKSLCISFGTNGVISPAYELYLAVLFTFTSRFSLCIILRTIFSETMMSSRLSNACILRQPYLFLFSANNSLMRIRKEKYLSGWDRTLF